MVFGTCAPQTGVTNADDIRATNSFLPANGRLSARRQLRPGEWNQMNKLYAYFGCLLLCLGVRPALAAGEATWSAQIKPGTVKSGGTAKIILTAKIKAPWHMYSLTQPAGGPVATTIKLAPGSPLLPTGTPTQPRFKTEHDKGFNMDIQIFEGSAAFSVPVKLKSGVSGRQTAKVLVRYQLCNQSVCLPPKKEEIPVMFTVGAGQ